MQRDETEELIVSIVLLLRKAHYFHAEELRIAAERAWGTSFVGGPDSRHFVMQSGHVTLMKAGPHLLSFLNVSKSYLDDPAEDSKQLSDLSAQNAWAEHRAWTAVDYVKGGKDPELEYSVLAKVVAELIDSNCAGVYVPAENSFMPNDALLYGELQKIAAARDAGIR
jgi:hypothetical protein